jgi:putative restriction endonuclease
MPKDTAHYFHAFTRLRTDRTGGWTDVTKSRAPHKPLLLLSILDLFAQGQIQSNFIEITPELGETFASYWACVMPPERQGNLALPFFHLRSSDFWHLLPQPGQEGALQAIGSIGALSQLKKIILGATLDEELYTLLQTEESRNTLRVALLETYFSPEGQSALLNQVALNASAFTYSQELIDKARHKIKEIALEPVEGYQVVRDQGFRRAIVRIYQHRCAFCGVKLITVDGHSVVEAAHIIPWSITHNDDLHNGMALCKLCHWVFDEGLMAVSRRYQLQVSSEMRVTTNMPGHLVTLDSRPILGPEEPALLPSLDALAWHRENVFRRN